MSNENQAELFDVRVAQQSRLENTRTRETESYETSVTFIGLRRGLQGQGRFGPGDWPYSNTVHTEKMYIEFGSS